MRISAVSAWTPAIALYAAMPAFAAAAQLVGGRGERVLAAAQVVDLGAKRLD